MKTGNSWHLAIRVLKNYRRHERNVQQSSFVRVEINSTIAKLSVCVWLEAAKLTCTSPLAVDLLQAVFTVESSLEINGRLMVVMASRF